MLAAGLHIHGVPGLVQAGADLVTVLVHGIAELLLGVVQETHCVSPPCDLVPVGVPGRHLCQTSRCVQSPEPAPGGCPGRRRGGGDGLGEDRPRAGPRRACWRRDREHRLDAGLPGDGHRHGEAAGGRTSRHHPPPDGRPGRDRARDRGRVPGVGARGDRGLPPPRGDPRPRRRFGALHEGDPGPVRVPGHRSRRTRAARGGAGGGRPRGTARPPRRARPRCGVAGGAEQRAPRRTSAGGHRDHRSAVQCLVARAALPLRPCRAGRCGHRPRDARPPDRAAGRRDVGRGFRRGGPDAGGTGPARGAYGEPGARLPAGPGPPRRGAQRGRGEGADGRRAPAGSRAARTAGSARTRGSPGSGTTTRSGSRRHWTQSLCRPVRRRRSVTP